MRLIALTLLAGLVLSTAAFADAEPSSQFNFSAPSGINIRSGDVSLSLGAVGLGYGSVQSLFLVADPRVEYFVMDRVSLGAQTRFNLSAGRGGDQYSIGPSATYHFLNMGKLSAYTGASFVWGNLIKSEGVPITRTLGLRVGANYNFTSWFGVGPSLSYGIALNPTTPIAQNNSVDLDLLNLYFYF